jgi:hypothetical protein
MKTSPCLVNDFLNSFTFALSAETLVPSDFLAFPSSSIWNLKFSRRITDPFYGFEVTDSAFSPTQASTKVTGLPSSFYSSGATGFNEYLAFGDPFGLPR